METKKELLFQVAKLYYEQNKTQAEISRWIHVSRPTVSRFLKQAREDNIVTITLNYPWLRDAALEKELRSEFNLRDVRVLRSFGQNTNEIYKGLGGLAAEYFDSIIVDGDIVCCSYGRTVASTIQALKPNRKLQITVVQMIGALGVENPFMDGPDLVRLLSEKYGGEYRYLLAPLVVKDSATRDSLMNLVRFRAAMELSGSARIGICGIGGMDEKEPSPIWNNYIDAAEWLQLGQIGAVGHIAAYFIDKDGKMLDAEINQRVIGTDFEIIKKIPFMIGVAGTAQKARAILSALRGKFLSVLITDDAAANAILEQKRLNI